MATNKYRLQFHLISWVCVSLFVCYQHIRSDCVPQLMLECWTNTSHNKTEEKKYRKSRLFSLSSLFFRNFNSTFQSIFRGFFYPLRAVFLFYQNFETNFSDSVKPYILDFRCDFCYNLKFDFFLKCFFEWPNVSINLLIFHLLLA